MSKFNLKDYQKTNGDEHITMRLKKDHSDVDEVINQKQLEDYRTNKEKEVIVEKLLDGKRLNAEDEITEKRLDTHKALFKNKYRNSEAYEGDINKLEEKRLKADRTEDEKYEPASSTSKELRWWENVKSPDGLKVSKSSKKIVTAQEDDEPSVVDDEMAKELEFNAPRWKDVDEEDEEIPLKIKPPTVEDPTSPVIPVDVAEDDLIADQPSVSTEEKDIGVEGILGKDDQFDVIEKPSSRGEMYILKQKDIPNAKEPGANGVYAVLAYSPEQFNGDEEAIKGAAYEKVISLRPELENAISPDDFGDIEEGTTGGIIKLRAHGEGIYNVFKEKGQFGSLPASEMGTPSSVSQPLVESPDFDELAYKEKDIGGTTMAIGKILTDVDVNPESKESVLKNAVKFITDNHPGIDVDINSLDLTKIDKGEISFMVSAPVPVSEKGKTEDTEETNESSTPEEAVESAADALSEEDEEEDISDEELKKLTEDYIEQRGEFAPATTPAEEYPDEENNETLVAGTNFDIKDLNVQSDTKKK